MRVNPLTLGTKTDLLCESVLNIFEIMYHYWMCLIDVYSLTLL